MRGKPPRQTSLTEEAFSADAAHQGERAGAPIQPGQAHPRALGSLADCKISVEGANRERSSPGSRRQTSRHGGLKRGQMGERRRQGLRAGSAATTLYRRGPVTSRTSSSRSARPYGVRHSARLPADRKRSKKSVAASSGAATRHRRLSPCPSRRDARLLCDRGRCSLGTPRSRRPNPLGRPDQQRASAGHAGPLGKLCVSRATC